MPITPIFSTNDNAAFTFTGNALGLSKALDSQDMGNQSSIGAYITTDTHSTVNNYPQGTTANYSSNSSAATLTIPPNSTILHAELIWGGSCQVQLEDHTSDVPTNEITFTIPTPQPEEVIISSSYSPRPVTKLQNSNSGNAIFYIKRVDVTSLVTKAMSGIYKLSGAIGTTQASNNSDNSCGWTLAVCYKNPDLPSRYLVLYSDIEPIIPHSNKDITISNFTTPTSGAVGGRILLSALHGSATNTGDQVLFGTDLLHLTPLSGPRNLENNFFGSQINNDNGELDTLGTFGDRNQDILNTANIDGGRQSQDITNVDATSKLTNNQTTAILQFKANDREYFINALGVQINIATPIFSNLDITTDKRFVSTGNTVNYTILVKNSGSVNAKAVTLTDTLPVELSYEPGTLTIDSGSNPGDPTKGISLGPINAGQTVKVMFSAIVNNAPTSNSKYVNSAKIDYSFDVSNNTIPPNTINTITKADTTTNTIYPASILVTPNINTTVNNKTTNNPNNIVNLHDTISYTITIENTDNSLTLTDITLKDTLPNGLLFSPNTVSVNNSPEPSYNPTNISIPNIPPGDTATISFEATVNSAPSDGSSKYINNAVVTYNFQPSNSIPLTNSVKTTNTVYLKSNMNPPNITMSAITNNEFEYLVSLGNIITYTINIQNTDNTHSLTDITLTDPLSRDLNFQPSSVFINDSSEPTANPIQGIKVPNIAPGQKCKISYKAKVIRIPPSNGSSRYTNTATVNYTIDPPDSEPITNSVTATNSVYLESILPIPTVTKADNTANRIVNLRDNVTYTITISNPKDTNPITDVTLTDVLPHGMEFQAGSVIVNNNHENSANPITPGIKISEIHNNAPATVSFIATVTGDPSPDTKYVNTANVEYSFEIPDSKIITNTVNGTNTLYPHSVLITPNVNTTNTSSGAFDRFVALDDIVTYTITIKNTDPNNPLTNIILKDTLPNGLSFKAGTVTIDTVNKPEDDPTASSGIQIPDIPQSGTSTISFEATVNAPPSSKSSEYVNNALIDYTFLAPDSTPLTNSITTTNTIYPSSLLITPNVTKTDDITNNIVAAHDTITYTITIENTDKTNSLTNITLKDPLPNGLSFKSQSVYINNSQNTSADPTSSNGISVPDILATKTSKISFQATVNDPLADVSKYVNNAIINYTFQTPDAQTLTNSITATDTLYPNSVIITPNVTTTTKTSNGSDRFIDVNDIVTYTITIQNTDQNNPLTNITLEDTLPQDLSFKTGTVSIDNVSQPNDTLANISISTIPANGTSTVSFQATVNSSASGKTNYVNTATINYTFQSPDSTLLTNSTTSTNTLYPISDLILPNVTKSDKSNNAINHVAAVGNTIEYTITVENPNASKSITNVNLVDTLPQGLNFNTDSLYVNGVSTPGSTLPSSISLNTIANSSPATVKFSVTVDDPPTSDSKYINTAAVNYEFPTTSGTNVTNTVTETNTVYSNDIVITPNVTTTDKTSNKINHIVAVHDTVTYTITIKNTDTVNSLTGITLKDTLPQDLAFNSGTVYIDSVNKPSDNPTAVSGINIPDIPANGTSTISFQATVNSAPSDGSSKYVNNATINYTFKTPDSSSLTNSVTTTNTIYPSSLVITPDVTKTDKTSNSVNHFVAVNDTVTYTITIENTDRNNPISNIILKDTLPQGLSFKAGTVIIDNVNKPQDDPTASSGITIPDISASNTSTISFDATVNSAPSDGSSKYVNDAIIDYTFQSPDSTPITNSVTATNTIYPDSLLIIPNVTKTDNTTNHIVAVNDTVTYTITIQNTDKVNSLTGITLKDALPNGLSFKPRSVIIDTVNKPDYDPTASSGITVPDISASNTSTISFEATVNALPSNGSSKYVNNATIDYTFKTPDSKLLTNSVTATDTIYPNVVIITPNVTKTDKTSNAVNHIVALHDTVIYTITIENTDHNNPLTNITLKDTLPKGLSFNSGTVFINNVNKPQEDPTNISGITVPDISANGTSTISFEATVNALPSNGSSNYVNNA
ncbi:DUF11 domain-containing protein, partial [Clostridium botulinum C]|uniref:isopeptide-forming domain-containing fimbrial protein n=1 Tax=Clostridium botulinum TaxID=1491 RepID=UPI001E2DEC15